MSYCRICEDSDVYVLKGSKFEVTLTGGKWWVFEGASNTYEHLLMLREAGYKIPPCATARLAKEILELK